MDRRTLARRPARTTWSFYELHVGTFTPAGTFEAIIPRLADLKELGVTAIELMPVNQFPGNRNWGYDGVLAVRGPAQLRRPARPCSGSSTPATRRASRSSSTWSTTTSAPKAIYLHEFGPYFTDKYKTPWGKAVNFDDAGSDAVRDFVLDNARMWLEEFHFDGLRLDAVHAIYDLGARHILRAIKDVADGRCQPAEPRDRRSSPRAT